MHFRIKKANDLQGWAFDGGVLHGFASIGAKTSVRYRLPLYGADLATPHAWRLNRLQHGCEVRPSPADTSPKCLLAATAEGGFRGGVRFAACTGQVLAMRRIATACESVLIALAVLDVGDDLHVIGYGRRYRKLHTWTWDGEEAVLTQRDATIDDYPCESQLRDEIDYIRRTINGHRAYLATHPEDTAASAEIERLEQERARIRTLTPVANPFSIG